MGIQFQRIANQCGDVDSGEMGELRFAAVEYAANIEMCKSLGIKKLPSVFIYSQDQLVDSFPCGPKKVPMLLEKLEHYHGLSKEELVFEASMKSGAQLGDAVLEQVMHTTPSTAGQPQQNEDDKESNNNDKFWPFSNTN